MPPPPPTLSGSEGVGLRTNVRRACSQLVRVDMHIGGQQHTGPRAQARQEEQEGAGADAGAGAGAGGAWEHGAQTAQGYM